MAAGHEDKEGSPPGSGKKVYATAQTDRVGVAIIAVAFVIWVGFRIWVHLSVHLLGPPGRGLADLLGTCLLDGLLPAGLLAGMAYGLLNAKNAEVRVSATEVGVRNWRRKVSIVVPWDTVAGLVWTEDRGAGTQLIFYYYLSLLVETPHGERRVMIARARFYEPKELVQLRDDLVAAHAGHWWREEHGLPLLAEGKTITWRRRES